MVALNLGARAAVMEEMIRWQNIADFRSQSLTETDPDKRRMLERLLTIELEKDTPAPRKSGLEE